MREHIRILIPVLAITFVVGVAGPANGQSFWFDHERGNSISLEMLKVDLKGSGDDFTFTTGAFTLNGQYRLGENVWFVGEIPFSHFDVDLDAGDFPAENAFGNPFLGIKQTFGNGSLLIGGRPPVAGKDNPDASIYGVFSDIDRYGAFLPDLVTVKIQADYYQNFENGMFIRGRIGPTGLIFTEDFGGDDFEVLLNAGGQVGVVANKFRGWAGANTLTVLTEDSFFGDDRITFEFAFGGNIRFDRVEPGLFFRFPVLTDYKELIASVFGLNVTVNLP